MFNKENDAGSRYAQCSKMFRYSTILKTHGLSFVVISNIGNVFEYRISLTIIKQKSDTP